MTLSLASWELAGRWAELYTDRAVRAFKTKESSIIKKPTVNPSKFKCDPRDHNEIGRWKKKMSWMAKAIWNCVILEKRQMSDYLVCFALWSDVKMYTELSVHISGSAVLLTCNYHDFRMAPLFSAVSRHYLLGLFVGNCDLVTGVWFSWIILLGMVRCWSEHLFFFPSNTQAYSFVRQPLVGSSPPAAGFV